MCVLLKKMLVHSTTSTKFIQMDIFTVPGACEIRVLTCCCVYRNEVRQDEYLDNEAPYMSYNWIFKNSNSPTGQIKMEVMSLVSYTF